MKNDIKELKPVGISEEDWECLNPSKEYTRLTAGVLEQKPGKRAGGKNPKGMDQRFGYEVLVGLGIILILTVSAAVAWILWAVVLSTPAHPG